MDVRLIAAAWLLVGGTGQPPYLPPPPPYHHAELQPPGLEDDPRPGHLTIRWRSHPRYHYRHHRDGRR